MLNPRNPPPTTPERRLGRDAALALSDSFHWYVAAIRRYPLLSREEEYAFKTKLKAYLLQEFKDVRTLHLNQTSGDSYTGSTVPELNSVRHAHGKRRAAGQACAHL
jgi:hypothetical protein